MISHVTVGTNDLERAVPFYDAIAKAFGAPRRFEQDRGVGWGAPGVPGFAVFKPFDDEPATKGNGSMIAFAAQDPAQVDQVYQLALSLGATDEGAPGQRNERYYAAYFRDLDQNKIGLFFRS